jgi:hypothetical protein
MSLSAPELKSVREHRCQAREHVDNAFSTTRAAGITTLARDLRHIRNSLQDAIADLAEMQAALALAPSKAFAVNQR